MADRTVSVKLKAEVATYVASMRTAGKATGDLEKASLKVQAAFSDEEDAAGRVRVAQLKLNELRDSGKAKAGQLAAAEEQLAAAERNLVQVRERAILVGKQFVDEQDRASAAIEETTESVEEHGRATEKVAARAQAQWKALVVAVAAGAPVAAATAIAAAVGVAAAGFVGLGAVALRNNTLVRQSFENLSGEIKTGLAQDAAVLEDEFVGAADQISDAFGRLRPEFQAAFSAAQPLVADLTGGVLDFAENAMPGMVRAVERAGPAVKGLRDLLGDTGEGLGEFFDEVSEHSEQAGQGMDHLGELIKGVLTGTAPILGDLTDLWAEHGDEVADVVTQLIGVVGGLAGSAMPALSAATGVALDALAGVLGAIEPMIPILGPLIGTWLALSVAMRTIGTVRGVVGNVADSVMGLGESMGRAGGKARAFRKGLLVAALGVGTVLTSLSQLNPEIEPLVTSLDKLTETGKVSGEATRVFGDQLQDLGGAFDTLTASAPEQWLGGALEIIPGVSAMSDSVSKSKERFTALDGALAQMVENGSPAQAKQAFNKLAEQLGLTGYQAEQMMALMPQFSGALDTAAHKSAELGTAAYQSIPGVDSLEESLKVLGDQTADTTDKVDALNDAWRRLFGSALSMEEATAAFEAGLDEMAASIVDVKEKTANWKGQLLAANGAVNLTTEAGRTLSGQLIQQGEDYRALAQTAYDTALQQGQSQKQAEQAAVAASANRRAQFISEARAMGFTAEQAETLATRYLGMPGDVITLIQQPGMAQARARARGYSSELNAIPLYLGTTVHTQYTSSGRRIRPQYRDGGLVKGYADGGTVQGFPSGGRVYGPGGPRDDLVPAMLSNGEFVVNAAATALHLPLLRAINDRRFGDSRVRAMANGGAVMGAPRWGGGGGSVTNIHVNAPNYVGSAKDLVNAIRGEVRKGGGGDVQKYLGRS